MNKATHVNLTILKWSNSLKYSLSQFTQNEIDNLDSTVFIKEIEFVT